MKTMTILTSHVGQTQGDISAALKLITYVIQKNNEHIHVKINWLLIFKQNFSNMELYNSYIARAQELGINVVTVFKAIEASEKIKELNVESDIYMIFPATPFHLQSIIWLVKFNKPIFVVSEYDYDEILIPTEDMEYASIKNILPKVSPNIIILKSGLGSKNLGIFSDSLLEHDRTTYKNTYNQNDLKILKLLNIIEQETLQLDLTLLNDYQQKTKMYFAYFNNTEDSQIINSSSVNPINFYTICLCLAMQNLNINVDFVINHTPSKYDLKFKDLKDKFSKIEMINMNGQITNYINLNANKELPKIRFFNPFPMSFSTYRLFLHMSESFSGLTGDQSLNEGLIEGKLIFYQIMKWKNKFAAEFINACNTYLGADSLLSDFYSMIMASSTYKQQKYSGWLSFFWRGAFDPYFFANFIIKNESNLLAQMKTLNKYINEHHDLAANLYAKIKPLLYNEENVISDTINQQGSRQQLKL